MIYTSYFAMANKLPRNLIQISISTKTPNWFHGLEYKRLAPTYEILMSYKENNDIESYIKNYNENILNNLSVKDVLYDLTGTLHVKDADIDICLLCYEKPSNFCHRQLVSKWLNDNGVECQEYERI